MTDVHQRLLADAAQWRTDFDANDAGVDWPASTDTSAPHRRWHRWLAPAAAALVVLAVVGVATLRTPAHRHPAQPVQHVTLPSCDGLVIAPLPQGFQLVHTPADARHAVAQWLGSDNRVTSVVAALVTDPSWSESGLPTTPQPTWVVSRIETIGTPSPSPGRLGPANPFPPGTVFHIVTLLDDTSLQQRGNITCGPPQLPQPH